MSRNLDYDKWETVQNHTHLVLQNNLFLIYFNEKNWTDDGYYPFAARISGGISYPNKAFLNLCYETVLLVIVIWQFIATFVHRSPKVFVAKIISIMAYPRRHVMHRFIKHNISHSSQRGICCIVICIQNLSATAIIMSLTIWLLVM